MGSYDINLCIDGIDEKTVTVTNVTKVEELKRKIAQNIERIELIYNGHILTDGDDLTKYKIENDDTIYGFHVRVQAASAQVPVSQLNNVMELFSSAVLGGLQPLSSGPEVEGEEEEEIDYTEQLQTLETMGFTNEEENRNLLELYNGNIEAVISALFE